MAHWALLGVVECKRNLGMQLEMKRDSSGSMSHWDESGTRCFFDMSVCMRDGLGVTTHQ